MRIDIIETDLFLSYLSEALNRDNLSPISGITTDSRHVKENDLFLAIKGEHFDGSDFIDEALSNGAIYAIAQSLTHFIIYYFVHPLFFFLECTFLLYTIVLYSTSDVTDVENMAYPTTTSISTSFSHSLK